MERKLKPINLAPALAEALKELHDCHLSVQFWSRYILQYARAVCEQKQDFSSDKPNIIIPMLPTLGALPPTAGKVRLDAALERARGIRLAMKKISKSTAFRARVGKNALH